MQRAHHTGLFFALQVVCWIRPKQISPDTFPNPLKETLSDFLLVSEPLKRSCVDAQKPMPQSAESDWPVNAVICGAELSEPALRLVQLLHPREHQHPGERHLQAVEAHVHQGEASSALSVSCMGKSAAEGRGLFSQGEFSSLFMMVNASLSVWNSQLFQLSSSHRTVSPTGFIMMLLLHQCGPLPYVCVCVLISLRSRSPRRL